MDQRTIARLDGQTAIMTEVLRLLVRKEILSPEEIHDAAVNILKRGIECGAQPGFDAVPMHVLRSVDGWKSIPSILNSRHRTKN